ncbi:MAG: hypothetical protein ABIH00_10985, partial [Armatimonadota bacterium]
DFQDKKFIKIFKKKLKDEGYSGSYSHNFGLDDESVTLLQKQIETDLMPVIRLDEKFNLNKVFSRFNKILS